MFRLERYLWDWDLARHKLTPHLYRQDVAAMWKCLEEGYLTQQARVRQDKLQIGRLGQSRLHLGD
jgi:hypothetical protein